MITLASRDKDGKPALWHVDAATWEEARYLLKEEVEVTQVVLALVPKEF